MLQKADALGATSDLFVAYKGPEEKLATVIATVSTSGGNLKEVSTDAKSEGSSGGNQEEQCKTELDDWEDAVDISRPKLESSCKGDSGAALHDEEGVTARKYSRDFLLTFSAQCTDLREGFEITSYVADALMHVNLKTSHGNFEYHSPGRIIDRPAGAARPDRHGNRTIDADRWNKQPGLYPSVPDPGTDLSYGGNNVGYHDAQGLIMVCSGTPEHKDLFNIPAGSYLGQCIPWISREYREITLMMIVGDKL